MMMEAAPVRTLTETAVQFRESSKPPVRAALDRLLDAAQAVRVARSTYWPDLPTLLREIGAAEELLDHRITEYLTAKVRASS